MPNFDTSKTSDKTILKMNYNRHYSTTYSRYSEPLAMDSETTGTSLLQVLIETKMRDDISSPKPYRIPWGRLGMDDADCDEVYPNIYIGDGETAKKKMYLKELGITHILNTAEGKTFGMVDTSEYFYRDTPFKYLGFRLVDLPGENISRYFDQVANFIDDGITSNGKVYVHCYMGVSRSATCVLAYLMLKRGYSAAEAIQIVAEKRMIRPNEGFLQHLADLDNKLRRERKRPSYLHRL